jgi:hypothetical protein
MDILTGVLSFALALFSVSGASAELEDCASSGYCSLGQSRSWTGDIRPSANFLAMLDSVTFKKELILISYEDNDEWHETYPNEEEALQLHAELSSLGFAHHAFLTMVPEKLCKTLKGKGDSLHLPGLSCMWDSTETPHWVVGGSARLWHFRCVSALYLAGFLAYTP